MTFLPRETLQQRANDLIRYHGEATRKNEWTFFVDEMYAEDCVYTCEYAGTFLVRSEGIAQIKATHYGRDMAYGWEGWTFPYMGVYVGEHNKIINHWMNRGPGKRADGRFFETPGVSFITFNNAGKICSQLDVFDLAHQMKLCDDLDAEGLLSAALKENWVKPMKKKLIDMLNAST
jgi:hypothetical protein